MKLKFIYGVIFGIYGCIIASIASLLMFGIVVTLLRLWVFSDSIWPLWARLFLGISCFLTFLGCLFIAVKSGIRIAVKIENDSDLNVPMVRKQAAFRFVMAFVVVFVFTNFLAYLGFTGRKNNESGSFGSQRNREIFNDIKTVDSLDFKQGSDGISIIVGIHGQSPDLYDLTVEISSSGYVHSNLMEFKERIILGLVEQKFYFHVTFDQLAEAYYREVLNYIPVFEKESAPENRRWTLLS